MQNGLTPLSFSIINGDKELVEMLLAAKASVDQKDEVNTNCIQTFLLLQVKDELKKQLGMTATHRAACLDMPHILSLLLAQNPDLSLRDIGVTFSRSIFTYLFFQK